ncbi:MAG: hypothetical protein HY701_04010, partial [Gemmatimonadetes bacterium]|nr:hypothetical protein [Gemmatimonadota bacterium]
NEYAAGDRELRVVFQRESGQFSGTGRHRVVVGMLNSDGTFDPAVVVYDQPPEDTGRGFGVVEICGDLYVRGTAFIHSVRKAPDSGDPNEQLDFILRQLAGPLAGAFRAFLTSDPQWLEEFAAVMAAKIGQAGAIQNAVIAALTASTTFTNNVINAAVTQAVAQAVPAAVTQAVAQAVPAAVAAVQQTGNLTNILNAAAALLDDTTGGSSQPLPADLSAKILAAMYRRLAYDPNLKNQIINSLPALSSERGWVTQALDWLP